MKTNKRLIEKVMALGFPLFEEEKTEDANSVLAEVVKSKDIRMWEGFPVLLAKTVEKKIFDFNLVEKQLKKSSDKSTLHSLTSMSLALYEDMNTKFAWQKELYKPLSLNKMKINELVEKFRKREEFKVSDKLLSSDRLISIFQNYYKQEESAKLTELIATKEEFDLEYAMSQIFAPKQKELFLKKLRGEKMTKTEKEYYSRAVKKKVVALANSELQRLAQKSI